MHDRSTVGWTQKAHDDDEEEEEVVVVVVEDKVVIKVVVFFSSKVTNFLRDIFFCHFFFLEEFFVCSFFRVSKKWKKKWGKSTRCPALVLGVRPY